MTPFLIHLIDGAGFLTGLTPIVIGLTSRLMVTSSWVGRLLSLLVIIGIILVTFSARRHRPGRMACGVWRRWQPDGSWT